MALDKTKFLQTLMSQAPQLFAALQNGAMNMFEYPGVNSAIERGIPLDIAEQDITNGVPLMQVDNNLLNTPDPELQFDNVPNPEIVPESTELAEDEILDKAHSSEYEDYYENEEDDDPFYQKKLKSFYRNNR